MKKHAESHIDHGFTAAQWEYIFKKYADKDAFFIDTFELPSLLGYVPNELYENVPESEVFYMHRGDRAWPSRMVTRPVQWSRFVRVIAGPHEEACSGCSGRGTSCMTCEGWGSIKHACILYTAYGVSALDMPQAPKEPGDIEAQIAALPEDNTQEGLEKLARLKAQLSESKIFWSTHALAVATH